MILAGTKLRQTPLIVNEIATTFLTKPSESVFYKDNFGRRRLKVKLGAANFDLGHVILPFAEQGHDFLDLAVEFGMFVEKFGGLPRVLVNQVTHLIHAQTDFFQLLSSSCHAKREFV